MDQDLKQYLDAMQGRMDAMGGHMEAMEGRLVNLIAGVKESLEREIAGVKGELHPMKDALERIEMRLPRHGGLIQG